MGNWVSSEKPPPVVLVPPLFDRAQLATRSRMMRSSYDVLFSKLARERLFSEYYGEAEQLMARIMLKPTEDPRVDLTATVFTPLKERGTEIKGDAVFRLQKNPLDPNNFMELKVASDDKFLQLRSCIFYPKTGCGAYSIIPLLSRKRDKDNAVIGLRYASSNLSVGTMIPPSLYMEAPTSLWMVGRVRGITAGCQYEHSVVPKQRNHWGDYQLEALQNLDNWSFAIDYGTGRRGPLNPSFNFGLEVSNNSKLTASYYHHLVVQRKVKNPFESEDVVAITNYIDLGFEFQHRLEKDENRDGEQEWKPHNMQIGCSWQANKNLILKAKAGILSSGMALIFKSWWQPSFTFSFAVLRDHSLQANRFSFGIQAENFGDVSYEQADPNYIMITPTKEQIAEGILKNIAKRPLLQTDLDSGKFDAIPPELHPFDNVL